jgi:hypothetical protein
MSNVTEIEGVIVKSHADVTADIASHANQKLNISALHNENTRLTKTNAKITKLSRKLSKSSPNAALLLSLKQLETDRDEITERINVLKSATQRDKFATFTNKKSREYLISTGKITPFEKDTLGYIIS